ncbi:MAG: hypothetical protein IPM66_22410 [Acidobacteriota bacterium]|nr:MAG: hypothetical protein IPM66_22410 [Acidobacteriota bacterium]
MENFITLLERIEIDAEEEESGLEPGRVDRAGSAFLPFIEAFGKGFLV